MDLVRSSISIASGLPCVTVRSAPAIVVSGPAQRLLTLWPARSPSRLATLYTESSDSFVASAVASIVTGWSKPVPGRELHPLKSSAFHGALLRQVALVQGANHLDTVSMMDRSHGYEDVSVEFWPAVGSGRSTGVGVNAVRKWARTLPRGAAVIDLGCGPLEPMSTGRSSQQ
jgi:hypothetical protein